jgi:hypothetical protein
MKDYFVNKKGTFTNINVADLDGYDPNDVNAPDSVWSTEKIDKLIKEYQDGTIELNKIKNSPFLSNNIEHRKPRLSYMYTKHEMDELKRCAIDPVYFADTYCKLFTDKGYIDVKLRDYQQGVLEGLYKHNKCILMASRQVGKTTTSAMFILWYVLFNKDKNVLMLGDISDTTKEIIDKVKNIMDNLPFFMKRGILINNVMSMKFDNGCRIIGRSTTKKSAIGLSINLLYLDEFAHINSSFIDYFWKSVYPTVSGTPNSRIVITSTPNGMNKFHDIWINAIECKGEFHPMRVDWWQVKGRDEEWKQNAINELGSIEDFNQEYGLQFYKGDNLLLNSGDIKKLFKVKSEYQSRNIDSLILDKTYYKDTEKVKRVVDFSKNMTWHPKFLENTFTKKHGDLKFSDDKYIFTIDTAKGVGKDHHVLNIFKFTYLPKQFLISNRNNIKDENDIFSLVQIGKFRANDVNIETFSDIVCAITYNLFNHNNVRIALELNNQGILVRDRLERHNGYWNGLLLWSKPSESSPIYEPGTDLTSNKKKVEYCEKAQYLISIDRIVTTCSQTFQELSNFGTNEKRTVYRCQSGNDDLAMSVIHSSAFFDSPQYYEYCEEVFDTIKDKSYLKILQKDVIDYNSEILGNCEQFDLSMFYELN